MRFSQPLDDLLQSRSHVRVLRALVGLPDEIDSSIREIARRAGVTHPTASSVLEALRQQGVVRVRRTLLADEYRFNTRHALADAIRSLFDLELQVRKDLRELLTSELLGKAPWLTEASLFGSFVRDEMRPDSDLDLALISPPGKASKLGSIIENLGDMTVQRFGNPINAVVGRDSIQAMAQPGVKGYRLWRSIAKEGSPIIVAGQKV
jgi:predicted nucleotidyltransferase